MHFLAFSFPLVAFLSSFYLLVRHELPSNKGWLLQFSLHLLLGWLQCLWGPLEVCKWQWAFTSFPFTNLEFSSDQVNPLHHKVLQNAEFLLQFWFLLIQLFGSCISPRPSLTLRVWLLRLTVSISTNSAPALRIIPTPEVLQSDPTHLAYRAYLAIKTLCALLLI